MLSVVVGGAERGAERRKAGLARAGNSSATSAKAREGDGKSAPVVGRTE